MPQSKEEYKRKQRERYLANRVLTKLHYPRSKGIEQLICNATEINDCSSNSCKIWHYFATHVGYGTCSQLRPYQDANGNLKEEIKAIAKDMTFPTTRLKR